MSKQKVQKSNLKNIAKTMKKMPVADRKISRREAVMMIKKDIMQMQNKGYTLIEIAEFLTNSGLAITPATLRVYVKAEQNNGKTKTFEQEITVVEKVNPENTDDKPVESLVKQPKEVQQKPDNHLIHQPKRGEFLVMEDIIL